ncbi:superoxide dismutase [Leptospira ellisii]|uniref:superoxide dismutase n=1 Tax=Leptospira ellisii TaxID=2023197 RepID=UPI001A9C41F6|nr:Fe-Mn family superoxide dismutase [Leptospira ellisii]
MNRKEFIQAFAFASFSMVATPEFLAADETPARLLKIYSAQNKILPLKFDPERLTGLSKKMILSHFTNNYSGAVKRLNLIEEKLKELSSNPEMKSFELGALKREELIATNSMILHELYFDNLGGNGKIGNSDLKRSIDYTFGSFDAWEKEFKNIALSLSGGSGWVVLYFNKRKQRMANYWCQDHTFGVVNAVPILVLDMYEHSYQIDFGANAKEYIDVFLRNVQWEVVEKRLEDAIA